MGLEPTRRLVQSLNLLVDLIAHRNGCWYSPMGTTTATT